MKPSIQRPSTTTNIPIITLVSKTPPPGKLFTQLNISTHLCITITIIPNQIPYVHIDSAPAISARRRLLILTAPALLLPWSTPQPSHAAPSPLDKPILRQINPEELKALEKAFSECFAKTKAPVMLRLVFHDAGTYSSSDNLGGNNASIQYELGRPENFGLKRGWNIIQFVADKLQGTAASSLSKADLIALAGAHAVVITGGPSSLLTSTPVGRLDAKSPDPEGRMPGEASSAAQLIDNFASKGLSVRELVVLSGSHTLGSKGYGDPLTFDNSYYPALLAKPWNDPNNKMASMIGIPTDHVLPDDARCAPIIKEYADSQELFYRDFSDAYVKMTTLGVQ